MHRRRFPPTITLVVILACAALAATAAATISGSAGHGQLSIANVAQSSTTAKSTPGWTSLPFAKVSVTVPPGGATINVRFTAQSKCGGSSPASVCSVKIGANGNQWAPKIAIKPFAFDSVANTAGGGGGKESHSVERSLTLPAGTYNVHIGLNVTPNTSFSVAYWHLAVETSAP
jgi:hypothetical protein